MTRVLTVVVALAILGVGAGSAGAQQTGDPVPTRASVIVPGAPPGVYWVVMVYGLTNQTAAPPSAWTRLVVGAPACVSPPLPPIVVPGSPVISGSTVALGFTGSAAGCAIDHIELEVGTTPGGREVGVFPLPGLNTFFPHVLPGSYYARARAVNAYGTSNRSREMPLQFPGPCASHAFPPMPAIPTATVIGSQVTLSWTLPPGAPVTFHQLALIDPAGFAAVDHILLSSATTVTVPNVPSGTYRVQISSGNACGSLPMPANYLEFVVP